MKNLYWLELGLWISLFTSAIVYVVKSTPVNPVVHLLAVLICLLNIIEKILKNK